MLRNEPKFSAGERNLEYALFLLVESEELIALLHDLAARVGTASDEHEYGDNKAIWLEDGKKVLDYMEADERFNAASFKDSMEEQGVALNKNDLTTLIDICGAW